jgi:hypothetical protein
MKNDRAHARTWKPVSICRGVEAQSGPAPPTGRGEGGGLSSAAIPGDTFMPGPKGSHPGD